MITLFISANEIDITSYVNASFEKADEREFQPDAAFYIGEGAKYLPTQNNSPINVDLFGPPTLIVEVGSSSLEDDLGRKRLLYERVGVREYWVVDVKERKVIAFSIEDGRSGQIHASVVLPGLGLDLVEEALRRSQTESDGALIQWMIRTFNKEK